MAQQRITVSTDPTARLRGYARRLRTAIHNHDRNDAELMDAQLLYSSPFECTLPEMTDWLFAQQLLTAIERDQAKALLPTINNPSCSQV